MTVGTPAASPAQTCVVTNGSGTVTVANVSNVAASCSTNTYTVSGTVTGLSGAGLVLQNNGGDALAITASGSFMFAAPVVSGDGYAVTVSSEPNSPAQTCAIAGGSGTVTNANVTSVAVTCTTNSYTVGVNLSGLAGGQVQFQLNGGDTLTSVSDGVATFAGMLASASTYDVSVTTQPTSPWQTCIVSAPTGSVVAANVSLDVTCSTNAYVINGTVTGLSGSGLALLDNGADNLAIPLSGAFSFATAIPSGAMYAVTVGTQPGGPTQSCVVSNGSGTVTNVNITNVAVSCSTASYTIGGTVGGLTGTGLVLQDNGGDSLPVTANGAFTFATSIASGDAYTASVSAQPGIPTQTCVVANGSGTVTSASVANISVSCTTNSYTVAVDVNGLTGGQVSFSSTAVTRSPSPRTEQRRLAGRCSAGPRTE